MKVLQTIAGFGALYGGIATCTYDLILAMYNIGFPIDLLTLEVKNKSDVLMGKGENWIKALPNDAITPYEYSKNISSYLQNNEYDLYHTNGLWMYCNHITCSVARHKRKPYIITPHGMLYPEALKRSYWKKWPLIQFCFRKDINHADCLHVTCKPEMEYVRQFGYRGAIAVIPNPANLPGYLNEIATKKPSFLGCSRLRKFGFLGRLHPRKKVENLLYGVALLPRLQDYELVIMGVVFVTGTDIGKDIKASKLLHDFDRVVLACGASNPRDINAPGRDAEGIYFAVDFLKANTRSLLDSNFEDKKYVETKGKNVVIIGGGDTGNDCVGTSIRHGAKSVTQIEMMPKAPDKRAENNPWPEWPKVCKTDYGQEEAIAVYGHDPRIYESTVKEFIKDKNGKLKAVKIVKLSWEKDPATGRMKMQEIAGSEQILDAEIVLIAAGFLGTQKYIADAFGVELNERTNVKTAPGKYQTSVENVFVTGDMHRGQSLVVWAIREGREAAHAVDESLMGYSNLVIQ